jgi:hypothetical protein
MSLIPPEATIRVWTCDCGQWWPDPPDQHWFEWNECRGTPTERVYVDLAAVDREVWAKRIARVLDPVHRRPLATDEALARAAVDALLGPEDRDA